MQRLTAVPCQKSDDLLPTAAAAISHTSHMNRQLTDSKLRSAVRRGRCGATAAGLVLRRILGRPGPARARPLPPHNSCEPVVLRPYRAEVGSGTTGTYDRPTDRAVAAV